MLRAPTNIPSELCPTLDSPFSPWMVLQATTFTRISVLLLSFIKQTNSNSNRIHDDSSTQCIHRSPAKSTRRDTAKLESRASAQTYHGRSRHGHNIQTQVGHYHTYTHDMDWHGGKVEKHQVQHAIATCLGSLAVNCAIHKNPINSNNLLGEPCRTVKCPKTQRQNTLHHPL